MRTRQEKQKEERKEQEKQQDVEKEVVENERVVVVEEEEEKEEEEDVNTPATKRSKRRRRKGSLWYRPDKRNSLSSRRSSQQHRPRKKKKTNKTLISDEEMSALVATLASAISLTHSFLRDHDLLLLPSQSLSLESSLLSSALSLSSLPLPSSPPPPPPPPPAPPSSSWFDRLLSSSISGDDDTRFREAFRLSKPSFDLLLSALSPSLPSPSALAATLFRLAHAAPYKSVARRFSLPSSPAAAHSFFLTCKAIHLHLSHFFSPSSSASASSAPAALAYSRFFTDRGDRTLIVQALISPSGRFVDVSAGWPGALLPTSILPRTSLHSRLSSFPPGGASAPPFVFGDHCCRLSHWLLTPFPVADDPPRRLFNDAHRRAMEVANAAFAGLSARWRLLSKRWKQECLEFFPYVVVVGCLLHNFLLDCGEPVPEGVGDYAKEQRFPEFNGEEDESGRRARDAFALHLSLINRSSKIHKR